uniref:Uncharacterized protein n=1 Tax=Rhizophora mucronata TaxID=61149 RepID=A0A2P2KAR3_RHIMU
MVETSRLQNSKVRFGDVLLINKKRVVQETTPTIIKSTTYFSILLSSVVTFLQSQNVKVSEFAAFFPFVFLS